MSTIRFLSVIFSYVLISSCSPLKTPTVTRNQKLEGYKYVFISPTSTKTGSTGSYGATYGSSQSNSVNPKDVIMGIFLKEGYINLPELKPELAEETIIVNYGESGKRTRGLGYTLEVTIQLISAKSQSQIGSCTAEGQGSTEADDIRQAITRCLTAIFSK